MIPLPDKYIRKAIFDLCNGMEVNGNVINFYDSRVTGSTIPNYYVLMTTQTNVMNEQSTCGNRWESSILLDIVTRYYGTGNTGSRVLADDIADEIITLIQPKLTLGGGLNVIHQTLDLPNDISSVTENENIFRKFIRIELLIN